jgi:hypothetical protein
LCELFYLNHIMRYYFDSWSISKLLDLYQEGKLDLNPPYQRNDIWSIPAKKKLIDTIKEGFPLPNFFLFLNSDGVYEMVDGQQRTRAFLGYVSGLFPDTNKVWFNDCDQNQLKNEYLLIVIVITDVEDHKMITDFYYKVNKFGTKLNRPEIIRSEQFENPIQKLIEDISLSEEFKELELFSESSEIRLMNQDFIGELLSLVYYGITDKKDSVQKLFTEINNSSFDLDSLTIRFNELLLKIKDINDYFPLKETRYKQRNDFYTLFSFIKSHPDIDEKSLLYMYEILIRVDTQITPSNENCFAFQKYAFNCVSQSNSKKARDARLAFFEELLLNTKNDYPEGSSTDILNDFHEILIYYNLGNKDLVSVNKWNLLPKDKLQTSHAI